MRAPGGPGQAEAPQALARQRAGQRLYIVPDQVNVSGCGTLFVGQAVRIQRPADLGPGFGGNPLHQAGIGHIFQKNRRNLLRSDLADDGREVPGAWPRIRSKRPRGAMKAMP